MLKSVLYYLLFLTTAVRLVDIVYLLTRQNTNLPAAVLVVTSAMIVYGAVLGVKRFFGGIRLKQLLAFYMVQSVMILFNITYVAATVPLQVSVPEMFVVGTFLDILVAAILVTAGVKHIRRGYAPMIKVISKENIG